MIQFPESIIKGDTLIVDITSNQYTTDDGFSVNVFLTGPSGTPVPFTFTTVVKTGSNNVFTLTVPATTTVGFQQGLFTYALVADDGTQQFTLESGNTTVVERADFLSTTDFRTHNRTVLDAVEAVIENRATQDQKSYTIAGRTLERMALEDLLNLRRYYKDLVMQEEGRARNKLKIRMGIEGRS